MDFHWVVPGGVWNVTPAIKEGLLYITVDYKDFAFKWLETSLTGFKVLKLKKIINSSLSFYELRTHEAIEL